MALAGSNGCSGGVHWVVVKGKLWRGVTVGGLRLAGLAKASSGGLRLAGLAKAGTGCCVWLRLYAGAG